MDRYYQLLDKDTSLVSPVWKGLHITSLVIAIVSGFITAYCLGKSTESFGNNCILYAKISFLNTSNLQKINLYGLRELPNAMQPIDMAVTDWGSTEQCYFCQFTPVMAMIVGIILCAWFLMCSRGGAGYITDVVYRPWRLIYPAIFFSVISTVVMLLSTVQLTGGIRTFCSQFKTIYHTESCTSQINEYTLLFFPEKKPVVVYLKISIYFSYVCFFGWLSQLTTLILRVACIADFQLIRITVTEKTEKEEIEQSIINPDDTTEDTLTSIVEETESLTSSTSSPGRKNFLPLSPHKPITKKSSAVLSSKNKTTVVLSDEPDPETDEHTIPAPKVSFIFPDQIHNAQENNKNLEKNKNSEVFQLVGLNPDSDNVGKPQSIIGSSFSAPEQDVPQTVMNGALLKQDDVIADSSTALAHMSQPVTNGATSNEDKVDKVAKLATPEEDDDLPSTIVSNDSRSRAAAILRKILRLSKE